MSTRGGEGTMLEVSGPCTGPNKVVTDDGRYVALLPVAAAEISADVVPLPGAALLFLSAGAAGGAFRFGRKKT